MGPILCLAGWFLLSAAPEPVHLDSARARQLVGTMDSTEVLPLTTDWTVIGPVGDSAILLARGTEFARVPWTDIDSTPPKGANSDPGWSTWDGFRPDVEHLRRWTAPPSGFAVRLGASTAASPGSFPTTEWTTGVEAGYAWKGWVGADMGIRWDRMEQTPRVFHLMRDSSLPGAWSWLGAICGPGVCLELERHALPIGSQSWRQSQLDSLLEGMKPGSFWKVTGDSSYSGAWERRLVAHFGSLEYRLSACPGLWSGSLQSLGLKDLPAGWATFGLGETWTSYSAASWLELAIGPPAFHLPRWGGLPWSVVIEPVRVRLDYRTLSQFSLSLQATVSIPDPTSAFGARIQP
ncbi:MAG TPA: hypothetical protein VN931_05950 [Fibrobacteria bacterium]|nr:hypothetical protein [Fibrobacteria bacterium]